MTPANPAETLLLVATNHYITRCLHVVANLGVADALGDAPRSAAELAASVGAHPEALDRVLRALSAVGIFEHRNGTVAHTTASQLLRQDHPHSLRPLVRMFGIPAFWTVAGDIEHSIRTGRQSDQSVPGGVWTFLAAHPEEGRLFDAAMVAKAHGQVPAVVSAYDFSPFGSIADIGGGAGHLLHAILEATPGATGVLFDQPHVVEAAAGMASDRLRLQAGDFFAGELPAADAYVLMEVIHDWDDERSTTILRGIRKAAPPRATVLLIESMLPEDAGPNWPRALDIVMLTISGRQRTQAEYAALMAGSGFTMTREIPTPAGVSIIEAVTA